MRILPILTAAAFALTASYGAANAQATPMQQKSDSQITAGDKPMKADKAVKSTKKVKKDSKKMQKQM